MCRILSSRVLALNLRRLSGDWQRILGHPLLLGETFVDTTRFTGACYRAANWQHLGETTGRGKCDRTHQATLPRKAVYVYPLAADFRAALGVPA